MKNLLVALVLLSGCSWFKTTAKKVEDIAIKCTEKAVSDKASELIPAIVAAAGGGSLAQIAEAFLKEFGQDIAACAFDGAKKNLLAAMPVGGAIDNDPTAYKLNNVSAVINSKKWVFAGEGK